MKYAILLYFTLLSISSFSQGNCPGEVVCTNQVDICQTGGIQELNASNQGCLTGNEATKSYWYQFCILTTGTLRFTINPNGGGNDYDWAIWGPNSTCPPIVAPLRCSYAAVSGGSDNTGVNSVNNAPQVDLTEGALGNQWTQDISAIIGECYVLCINNFGAGSNTFSITFGGTSSLFCSALPIELISWNAEYVNGINLLTWKTATETNNDYFIIERTIDGMLYEEIGRTPGSGNSSIITSYSMIDNFYKNVINYYRLTQVDFNGNSESFNIISVDNTIKTSKKVIRITNMLGQEVNPNTCDCVLLYHYDDGTHQKIFKVK